MKDIDPTTGKYIIYQHDTEEIISNTHVLTAENQFIC